MLSVFHAVRNALLSYYLVVPVPYSSCRAHINVHEMRYNPILGAERTRVPYMQSQD